MSVADRCLAGALMALVVAGLPLAGHWMRQGRGGRCALDGDTIDPVYRVRVVDGGGKPHEFCCIRCAQSWLELERLPPRTVFVTDETSGGEIAASAAFFVRSMVVTKPSTGNRIHAFASRADALQHTEQSHGTLLAGDNRPFQLGD